MDSIANQFPVSPNDAQAVARKQYVAALRNENDTSPGARESLLVAAHVLGKTSEHVAADVVVIRRVKQLEALTGSVQQIIHAADQASKKLDEFDQDSSRIQSQRVELRKKIAGDLAAARGREVEAKNADLELRQIRNSNPGLLD